MPQDVIDLISSPEVEPRPSSVINNRSSYVPPPSAQRNIQHDDLDDDLFDLTADDVLPLPASKTPARRETGLGTVGLPGDRQASKSISGSFRSTAQKETSALDLDMSWLSSDPFQDIENIPKSTNGGNRTSEPARKRQRLSSSPARKSNSPKGRLAQTYVSGITKSPARPGPSKGSSSRVMEDVEFSSSLGISSPKISQPPAPAPLKSFRDYDDDSDPFASPPPRPRPTREEKGKGPALPSAPVSAKATPEVTVIEDSDDDGPFAATPVRTSGIPPPKHKSDEDPFTDIPSPPKMNPKPREPPRATTSAAAWDPISSSAPLPAKPSPGRPLGRSQSNVIALDDSDEDLGTADPLSDNDDDDEFPDISDLRFPAHRTTTSDLSGPTKRTFTKSASTTTGSTRPKPAAGGAKKTAEERAREKEDKALEKKAAAERKKQEREREKQQRVEEKLRAAARAEVNKLKISKEKATPEMMVDLPSSLDQAARIKAEEFLKKVEVKEVTTWTSPVDNVVRWRRVVNSRYNEESHHYDPLPETIIETEKSSLVILPATEFAKLAMGAEGHNLEAHVLKMQRHFPGHRTIYLIEGLKQLIAKSRNKRNREFTNAVRSGLAGATEAESSSAATTTTTTATTTTSSRRTKKNNNDPLLVVNESQIDTALLQLQLLFSKQIVHTTCAQETASQIQLFTQQLAVAPYKTRQDDYFMKSAGFCMDSGQVRTGIEAKDIYVRTLQEVARITAPIAMGIANEYPSVGRLVNALERGGPGTLEDVRRVINREGEVGEKRVGKAVSKRLWKIFTGRDEGSTEV